MQGSPPLMRTVRRVHVQYFPSYTAYIHTVCINSQGAEQW